MEARKLTEYEYKYMWYIEYGTPFHYIPMPPEADRNMIGVTIKTLMDDGMLVQYANPTLDKSPLYTRFTKEGRMLFLAHEWILDFRHPTELEEFESYDNLIKDYIPAIVVPKLKRMLR